MKKKIPDGTLSKGTYWKQIGNKWEINMGKSKHRGRLSPAATVALAGAGIAGAYAAYTLLKRASIQQRNQTLQRNQRIVILGGGFAGTNVADQLAGLLPHAEDATITLVDQNNYSLFTPMLTEVTGGQVDTHHIVRPLRDMSPRIEFVQGRIAKIDIADKCVTLTVGDNDDSLPQRQSALPYDHLVIAVGSVPHYYDIPGLKEHSLTNKTLEEAAAIRKRVLAVLERANCETDGELCRALLTIVVGGGGYTGVETIAAINDLVRDHLPDYPNLRQEDVHMLLFETGERLMTELSAADLASYAQHKLEQRGVEVRLNTTLAEAGENYIRFENGERLAAHTLIWAGGVTPDPIVEALGVKLGKHKGIVVDACCAIPDHPGVWAAGDCAEVPMSDGDKTYAPTAQNAQREGAQVARNIVAILRGEAPQPFVYTPIGELAIVGKRSGVAEVYGMRFSGITAWAMWRVIYLAKMPGLGQRTRILLDWLLDTLVGRDVPELSTLRKQDTAKV